jgi:hypothetical protein
MIGALSTAVAGKLADRWAAASAPALVFWLGGLLAWASGEGGRGDIETTTEWLNRQTAPVQVAVIVAALLAVTGSAIIVERLTTPVLRLLEGYWPGWLAPLRRRLVARAVTRAKKDEMAWQELVLEVQPPATPDAEQLAEFARLDDERRRRPSAANRYMPTRIGNILRAAETRPRDKYGLDVIAVWPQLWLVLPDTTRTELTNARIELNAAAASAIWGLLFCAFAVLTLLAVPVGLVVALATIRFWVPARAKRYGDLVEAAYDLHRFDLYEQLRWPLPTNPREERRQGERLTRYLWRGSDAPEPTFTSGA